ncbi:MAG: PIG-L deacetylase family protein [Promethearchaeota archaeon]
MNQISSRNKPKVLFVVPHPDDLEFGVGIICIEALKAGFEVVEVVMTGGEYGTKLNDFKGVRIKRIRARELENSIKVYEKYLGKSIKLVKLGFIDGHLRLNRKNLNKIIDLLKREKPKYIFIPDPFFPVDFHNDHINTGKLIYIAAKKTKAERFLKKIFFYYTFKPNFNIRCNFKDINIVVRALGAHKSQMSPFFLKLYRNYMKLSLLISFIIRGAFSIKIRSLDIFSEAFFQENEIKSLTDIIKYSFFKKWLPDLEKENRFYPTPKELNLI